MKVKVLKQFVFEGSLYRKGKEVELKDNEAKKLIKANLIEEVVVVKPKQPKKTTKKETV